MIGSGAGRLLRVLAFVLALPVAGAAASAIVRWQSGARFVGETTRGLSSGDPARNRVAPLQDFCAAPGGDDYEVCVADARHRLLGIGSAATGAAGLLVLVAIAVAGTVAGGDRRRLLAVFRPGLYVTAAAATVLIVLHTLIAVVILAGAFLRLPPFLFFAIIGGALSGLLVVVRSLFGAVRPAQVFAFGGRLSPPEAPELWRRVTETASRLGALPPDEIVAGLDVNFFVTQAEVITPNGPCRGRTLFCSLPLARILTVDEFTAIVGHELGHFRGEDTAMSQQFYPIYRGTTAAIDGLAASGGGARGLALLPAAALLGFFLDRFAAAERRQSRARELLADRAGVEATSVRAMAAALAKTHAYADLWPAVVEQLAETPPHEHRPERCGSLLFASAAAREATPRRLEDIAQTSTSHPTDTHPTLEVRLEALGIDLAGVSIDALHVAPTPPAISVIPTAELHERALGAIVAMSRARSHATSDLVAASLSA
jgi:Zn-dependent protease with chaperone function